MRRAIVFVLTLWLLAIVMVAVAKASTPLDATKVAWYLKGEGDAIMPSFGLVVTDLSCRPTTTKYVACKLRSVTPDYRKALCSSGKFTIKDYAAVGQWSKPRACITS